MLGLLGIFIVFIAPLIILIFLIKKVRDAIYRTQRKAAKKRPSKKAYPDALVHSSESTAATHLKNKEQQVTHQARKRRQKKKRNKKRHPAPTVSAAYDEKMQQIDNKKVATPIKRTPAMKNCQHASSNKKRSALIKSLGKAESVAHMVVLKELLDKPISLRK